MNHKDEGAQGGSLNETSRRGGFPLTFFVSLCLCGQFFPTPSLLAEERNDQAGAELDTQRLLGKAYYENDDYEQAAGAFRRCIEVAPESAADYFNLALVLMRANQHAESLAALDKAEQRDRDLIAVQYLRGIIYQRELEFDKAIASLERVTERDRECLGAFYNLGACYKNTRQYDKAIGAFEKVIELDPKHPSAHFQLITLYRQTSQIDKAERHIEIYDLIKDTIDESEKTVEALERSQYTYIIESPARQSDVGAATETAIRFVDVSGDAGLTCADCRPDPAFAVLFSGGVSLADYDGDGDLDVYIATCARKGDASADRVFRNDSAKGRLLFADVTESAAVVHNGLGRDAVWGDYDNDGHLDLYVVCLGPNALFRNKGDGTFENVSESSRTNEPQGGRRAVFVDYDHDNDLDLFIANEAESLPVFTDGKSKLPESFGDALNTLLRNNGNGTFTDQTDEAGLLVDLASSQDVLFGDLDADADVDLVIAHEASPSLIMLNMRLGQFKPGGSFKPPLEKRIRSLPDGDFNRDGNTDIAAVVEGNVFLYINDGKANFTGTPVKVDGLPALPLDQVLFAGDLDNDGWCDLLARAGGSLRLLAGAGSDRFRDISDKVGLTELTGDVDDVACGDLDNDGDLDVVLQTSGRGPVLLRNDGGDKGHWLCVTPVGKKTCRTPLGASVEIAAAGYYQKRLVRELPVHFGLGQLDTVDVVRVTWPSGIAQNVIRPEINRHLSIEEYVKVSVSCGFLWADGGKGFKLVNEILGVGPLGVPMAPGVYHQPDCTELTKIQADQLVVRDGIYELRLTEDLREITFADQITLRVIDHPAGLEIIPNEYFCAPPFPQDRFYAVADNRPPLSAVDDRGNDVLDLVRQHDGQFPTFPLIDKHPGLAEPHSITVDLGPLSDAGAIMLYLDSWIYWAESSTVMAIAQDPRYELTPLKLEVRDSNGRWQTAIESVGLPTSKGLVVPVDLTGKFLCDDYHVRLSTTMCVFFDRIFISTGDEASGCRVTELPVSHAELRYRGFARLMREESGYERFDYDDVSPWGSWNPPTGMLTRYGDVTPLLERPDDMYVIFGPGDELAMHFDARRLPELPAGWTRDFIFYANGWVKDGDLNTKDAGTVTPLPFHAMSTYPYPDTERYPDTPEHRRYLRTYNTRLARPTIGTLTSAHE